MRSLLFAFFISSVSLSAEEWWAWTHVECWRHDSWSAGVFAGNRWDVDDGAYVQILSPRIKVQLQPWLESGFGLSSLSIEDPNTKQRGYQLRPELELNPKFDLGSHIRLEIRNRLEWRKNEGSHLTRHRSRHRLQLGVKLPKPLVPLTRVFANNEWLVDLHRQRWTENRLVPLGATFRVTSHADLDIFYMILSQDGSSGWRSESILGTYLRLRF